MKVQSEHLCQTTLDFIEFIQIEAEELLRRAPQEKERREFLELLERLRKTVLLKEGN